MPGPVERWLETFMCKQYADTFEVYGFKTLQSVCQLQLQQLQAMGVAQEHCDMILDNVHVLRQSLSAGGDKCNNSMYHIPTSTVRNSMHHHAKRRGTPNHYQEDMYGPGNHGNRMQGYMMSTGQAMGVMNPNMPGYPPQSHGNYGSHGQQGQMMSGHHQGNYPGQDMYHSHSSSQQYRGQSFNSGSPYPQNMGQFGNQSGNYGPNTGNTGYGSAPASQNPSHHHMRHSANPGKNPQEVANSILQMAVSSYSPNHTVQVPLSKNRSAPYHVPKSPHYNITGRNSPPLQQQMNITRQFVYPNSSPHHPARTSPISPAGMPMHSPVSHHSGQSIPSSSPRSIHSPTHGGTGSGSVRSPISAASPADMRSPCTVQSPASMCSPPPVNQPLHVSVSSGQHGYGGHIQSPTQKMSARYSPKTNPISPPGSQVGSPYTSISSIHSSPPQVEPYTSPPIRQNYVGDTLNDVKSVSSQQPTNNPLQSLQKLCMLPETQVIDPKSVVNDACISSPNSYDNSKNLNSDVDSHNISGNSESASKSQSPKCNDGKHCVDSVCDSKENKDMVDKNAEHRESVETFANKSDESHVDRNSREEMTNQEKNMSVLKTEGTKNYPTYSTLENKESNMNESKPEVKDHNVKGQEVKGNTVASRPKKECENRFKKHLLNGDITSDEKILNSCLNMIKPESKDVLNNNVSCDKSEPIKSLTEISSKSALNLNSKSDLTTAMEKTHNISNKKAQILEEKSPVKEINGKIELPSSLSVQKISSEEEHIIPKQKEQCRTQVRRTRSLRGIPARLVNTSYCEYSDSDDSDYHVRKDIGSTYSRQEREDVFNSRFNRSRKSFDKMKTVHDSCSDDENVNPKCIKGKSSGTTTNVEFQTTYSRTRSTNKSLNKVNENGNFSMDQGRRLKSSDNSEDHSNTETHGNPSNHGNSVNHSNQVNSDNPGHHSNPGSDSDCIVLSDDSVDESKNKTNLTSNVKTSPSTKSPPEKLSTYSRRKRRKSAANKYSDVYYGEDYALDSEEEAEWQKKNKKSRKSKLTAKQELDDMEVVFEYEGVDEGVDIQLSQHSDEEVDADDDVDDESYVPKVKENPKPVNKFDDIGTSKKSSTAKNRGRPRNKSVRPAGKSKGKIKKLEKSKSGKNLFERESFEGMRLNRTVDLMKKTKGKRKFEVCDKLPSPFIKVRDNKDSISLCTIVNQPDEEKITISDKKVKKHKTASLSVSTVHMSKLPSEKSICVPSSNLTEDENWNCALCGKHSSYKFLGDLFGPYYVEGQLPSSKQDQNSAVMDSKGKRRSQDNTTGKRSKESRRSAESSKPREVWVHEDCVAWSDGVLLIGQKIYGLNEATHIASSMMCSACREKGAMMGCLHKGCSQKFHSYCAVESGCYLDEENFSLLCPKHKDKKLRLSDASTPRS